MTIQAIKKKIIDDLKAALPHLPKEVKIELELPPQLEWGDFSFPCFGLAPILKKSPEKIAEELAEKLPRTIAFGELRGKSASYRASKNLIEKVVNVGPYLNFFLKKDIFFKTVLKEILEKRDDFGKGERRKEKILIEYSGPNTNKPQHLGHLRNNFLGMAIGNLLEFEGQEVTRINLVNDRGIHIAKAMLAYLKRGEGKTPEFEGEKGDFFVGKYYVLFEQMAKERPELLVETQELLKKWEMGDEQTLALWRKMTDWAIKGLEETYQKIGTKFDKWFYESDFYKEGKKIVKKALKKSLCYRRNDKAIEIDLTLFNLGKKVLLRPDETSVYITQDLALSLIKQKEFKPKKSIYVVASEQDAYFKALFKILEIFGYKWAKELHHLSYGMVFLPEGRMKSREGKVVEADDLIALMEKLAKEEILSREKNIAPDELSKRAKIVALASLKFYFLHVTPPQDITFDPDKSISFMGATGPYLLYTCARIQSILRKANSGSPTPIVDYSVLKEKEERELIILLANFEEVVSKAALFYNPACLAEYLLSLAQKFNEFYHLYPVLKAADDLVRARLSLCQAIVQVLKNGLSLLGIETVEKM